MKKCVNDTFYHDFDPLANKERKLATCCRITTCVKACQRQALTHEICGSVVLSSFLVNNFVAEIGGDFGMFHCVSQVCPITLFVS